MRVLVIDQFDICRIGMKNILRDIDPECEFLEAKTIDEGIVIAGKIDLDLVIIDMDTQDYDSSQLLDKIALSDLESRVLLFSGVEEYHVVRRAYEMGIGAFVKKQTTKEIIIPIIQILLSGGRYFSPDIVSEVPVNGSGALQNVKITTPEHRPLLSDRQLEVLKLLAEGKPNKIIARELDIATGTVKVHIAGILKALKAKNRTQAVSIANHINIL